MSDAWLDCPISGGRVQRDALSIPFPLIRTRISSSCQARPRREDDREGAASRHTALRTRGPRIWRSASNAVCAVVGDCLKYVALVTGYLELTLVIAALYVAALLFERVGVLGDRELMIARCWLAFQRAAMESAT